MEVMFKSAFQMWNEGMVIWELWYENKYYTYFHMLVFVLKITNMAMALTFSIMSDKFKVMENIISTNDTQKR
jgi:hypothetical protein